MFPYTEDQSALSEELWTNINACNKYDDDDDRTPTTVEDETDVEGIIVINDDPVTEEPVVEDTLDETAEPSCEFDGEGLLCYDPETDSFFYDFTLDI